MEAMSDKSLFMDLLSKLEARLRNYSIKKENLIKLTTPIQLKLLFDAEFEE